MKEALKTWQPTARTWFFLGAGAMLLAVVALANRPYPQTVPIVQYASTGAAQKISLGTSSACVSTTLTPGAVYEVACTYDAHIRFVCQGCSATAVITDALLPGKTTKTVILKDTNQQPVDGGEGTICVIEEPDAGAGNNDYCTVAQKT